MTKFRNMKIAITEDQPLDDVVRELERLGYEIYGYLNDYEVWILTQDDGSIIGCDFEVYSEYWELTTLAELKEME